MTTRNTPLAHLSPRFTDRAEDVAVESLGYILSKSKAARDALEGYAAERRRGCRPHQPRYDTSQRGRNTAGYRLLRP